jgi:S1-C subfamily serine protease
MAMNRRTISSVLLTAGIMGALAGVAVRPAGSTTAAESGGKAAGASGLNSVRAFSQASQELYRKLAPSIVHVRMELRLEQLLPESLQKEWERPARGAGSTTKPGNSAGSATQPHSGRRDREHGSHGGDRPVRMREYLEERLRDQKLDPDAAARIRQNLIALRQGQGGDLIGIIVDGAGHVLVHAPLIKGAGDRKLRVILPNGTESSATVAGTDMLRGLSIITLASPGAGTPVPLATGTPAPGTLLLGVSASRGTLMWVVASESSHHRHEMSFMVGGAEDRGPTYLLNVEGQLAGLNWGRRAASSSLLGPDIKALIENHPLPRRVIGVTYSLVGADSPLRDENTTLGLQPAVVVEQVTPKSPAARAGLVKGDFILSIDHKPINQLWQVLADIRDRSGDIDIDIIRGNEPRTLKLSFERSPRP